MGHVGKKALGVSADENMRAEDGQKGVTEDK